MTPYIWSLVVIAPAAMVVLVTGAAMLAKRAGDNLDLVDVPPGKCPKCGGPTESGYGFSFGGGQGQYEYCAGQLDEPHPDCEWFKKTFEADQ